MQIEQRRHFQTFNLDSERTLRQMADSTVGSLMAYGYRSENPVRLKEVFYKFLDQVKSIEDAQAVVLGCHPQTSLSVGVLLERKTNLFREELLVHDLVDSLPRPFGRLGIVLDQYTYQSHSLLLKELEHVYPAEQFAKIMVGLMEESPREAAERLIREAGLRCNYFGKSG